MQWQRKTAVLGALMIVWLFTGCEPVREPWVQSAEQWQKERARSPEKNAQLRHRLAHTQIDR